MSLVGPRPHAVAHNQLLSRAAGALRQPPLRQARHDRLAQIYGFRGPTEDPEKMRKRVQHGSALHRELVDLLDLRIIALTPFLGFVHRNAF